MLVRMAIGQNKWSSWREGNFGRCRSRKRNSTFPCECPLRKHSPRCPLLPRMFIEPDGSFVWVSTDAVQPTWQVDGSLYDRNGRLLYTELKGTCSRDPFQSLLGALGAVPSSSELVVQLVRYAVILETEEFVGQFLGRMKSPTLVVGCLRITGHEKPACIPNPQRLPLGATG